MTRQLFTLSALALVGLTLSCAQAPKPADTHDTDVQAIKDIETQWNKDYEAKDADKVIAHYTDDAVLMAPFAASYVGKAAFGPALKQMVAIRSLAQIRSHPGRGRERRGHGIHSGLLHLDHDGLGHEEPATDHGSYATVYKKQADGSWKVVSDIASSAVLRHPPRRNGNDAPVESAGRIYVSRALMPADRNPETMSIPAPQRASSSRSDSQRSRDYATDKTHDLRARREAVVNAHIEAETVTHDVAAALATFHHPRYEVPAVGAIADGGEAVEGLLSLLLGAFPDFWLKRLATYHADDAVIVECKFGGTHRGTWAGAPTGNPMEVQSACILSLRARIWCAVVKLFDGVVTSISGGVVSRMIVQYNSCGVLRCICGNDL